MENDGYIMIYYWEYNGTPDIELGNPVIINQQ